MVESFALGRPAAVQSSKEKKTKKVKPSKVDVSHLKALSSSDAEGEGQADKSDATGAADLSTGCVTFSVM